MKVDFIIEKCKAGFTVTVEETPDHYSVPVVSPAYPYSAYPDVILFINKLSLQYTAHPTYIRVIDKRKKPAIVSRLSRW